MTNLFMPSRAMRFAGLVTDRQTSEQAEFLTWWDYQACDLYPKAWHPSERLASRLDAKAGAAGLPLFLLDIYAVRDDLRAVFPLPTASVDLLRWYLRHGEREFPGAPRLKLGMLPRRLAARLIPEFIKIHARQVRTAAHAAPTFRDFAPPTTTGGVNLIGFPRGEFGLGEDIRTLSQSLSSAGVPHAILNLKTGSNARQLDGTLGATFTDQLPYRVSIFCTNPFDCVRLHLEHGEGMFRHRYNIGHWPWELDTFPPHWVDAFTLVDEVWAISRHTQRAFAPHRRTRLVPPAVYLPDHFTLRRAPHETYRFVVAFDPNSSIDRKNPIAALHAFRAAFGPEHRGRPVSLAFLVNGQRSQHEQIDQIEAACLEDGRISIFYGTKTRDNHLRLLADADCLVSPHRAEGFGRNIAEAKLLFLDVLATGFSGSNDITNVCERINWRPIEIGPGQYPHAEGLMWADADVGHLGSMMRSVVETAADQHRPLPDCHGRKESGQRYKSLLEDITAFVS